MQGILSFVYIYQKRRKNMKFWCLKVELTNDRITYVRVSSKTLSGAVKKAYQQYDIESIKWAHIIMRCD